MILNQLTALQVVLTAAKTTNDMDVTVEYLEWVDGKPSQPQTFRVATNGSTDVTILSAPQVGRYREPLRVCIYNRDTADKIVIVKTDDGSAEFIEVRRPVTTVTSLVWEKDVGWYQA